MKSMAPLAGQPAQALIGRGPVLHKRLRPQVHQFCYSSYFLMLPMRTLRAQACAALNRNGWGWLSFHDADHGDGGPDALAWLDALLTNEGITDATGEVWLHCFPRVLGYAFKPVSFWYCHREDGSLAAIVVEVNNTFGERHFYLLAGPTLAYGRELTAAKVFHVSPFCAVEGGYRFRFLHSVDHTVVCIDHDDAAGPLLLTSISGALQPLTRSSARAAFWALPAFSLMLMARIHWQALRLWVKRTPFFAKPVPPRSSLTR